MVDDRLPGDSELREKQYLCPMPGCKERRSSFSRPDCRAHGVPMVPVRGGKR
ncbi:hypothetical protein [Amycolatopsis sp. NPDC021455]|uniref:hypothetical protein n=1 Tax=Amycolatopsis sp. NPDC021455 TaxID=3154901 RepID=UPI0033CC58A2